MKKMDPEVKTAWTEALRSGDYKQGGGSLVVFGGADDVYYCCLGVLCELAVKAGIVTRHGGKYVSVADEGDANLGYLPKAVQEWAGLNHMSPIVQFAGHDRPLAGINDGGNATFKGIADLIEEQL